MKRSGSERWLVLLAVLLGAPSARADVKDWNGHLAVGYTKLFAQDSPAGSLSLAAGFDYPLAPALRAGASIGYHLLGSRTVVRGSLVANVDYSVFEAVLFAHWMPPQGLLGRVSIGPALFSAHADLSTTGGGAAFSDLAVAETAPGAALDMTVIGRSPAPVKVGLELGTRVGFLSDRTWTLATVRFAVHY